MNPRGAEKMMSVDNRAPNANPHVERFHRTLRQDALNHFIFLNAVHVGSVAREFIEYYNRARPSQATHAIPDPYPELIDGPLAGGKLIVPVCVIAEKYPGGLDACSRDHASLLGGRVGYDDHLFRDGAMSPEDADQACLTLCFHESPRSCGILMR